MCRFGVLHFGVSCVVNWCFVCLCGMLYVFVELIVFVV